MFRRVETNWGQVAYLKASNTEANDDFGTVAVSGDGNTIAVGAIGEGSNATGVNGDQTNNLASQSGAVYIFTTDGTTWRQEAYLKASNTDVQDGFGYSVSLSADGSMLAVGANGEDSAATGAEGDQTDNSAGNSGATYVFQRTQAGWSETAYLKASNTHVAANFGNSVSLSGLGTTLAVGAPGERSNGSDPSDESVTYAGAAYVFGFDGTAWSQRAYLKAGHPEMLDLFGNTVSLSLDGKFLAISDIGDYSIVTDSGAIATFAETASRLGAARGHQGTDRCRSPDDYQVGTPPRSRATAPIFSSGRTAPTAMPARSTSTTSPHANRRVYGETAGCLGQPIASACRSARRSFSGDQFHGIAGRALRRDDPGAPHNRATGRCRGNPRPAISGRRAPINSRRQASRPVRRTGNESETLS